MLREDIYYDSRDGVTKIHAVQWSPKGTPRAVVQLVHGMMEHVERYGEFAGYLNERGILVVGNDHLGHGKSRKEEAPLGYFCRQDPATVLVRDVHRLKKITQEKNLGVPYIIAGHSMGSFILRNYMFRYGKGIDGAVIMGTGNPPADHVRNGQRLVRLLTLLRGPRYVSPFVYRSIFGSYNDRITEPETQADWLTRDKQVLETNSRDALCGVPFTLNGYDGLLELIRRAQKPENLKKVPPKLPVLILSGAEDPVGGYGLEVEQVRDMLEKAGLLHVFMKLYPGDRHEVLNELDRRQVYEDFTGWVEKVLDGTIFKN